jgi:type IV secretion system protein VirB10
MRLAMRLPAKKGRNEATEADPREEMSAEIIDFASRTSYPAVTQRKGRSDTLGMVAGIAIVAVLGAATLWGMNLSRTDPGPQQQVAPLPPQAAAQPGEPAPEGDGEQAAQAQQADPAPSPVLAAPPQMAMAPATNPYSSPTMVYDASITPPAPGAIAEGLAGAEAGSVNDFASRIGGIGGGPVTAARNFDPATTVTQGTLIPAVLETAINTDVPGYVRAIVSQDVRSYDGRRVLVPRSSRLIGQYQSGLQAGQKRAYVIWTRLIRPDGVSVQLASPATDFAGNTGLPGDVDSHFFQRFGSAMLLSVIGGLTTIASGGASIILGGGGGAAAAAVDGGSKIGPTVRVRQGEPIRVFTARDLDFSQAPRL